MRSPYGGLSIMVPCEMGAGRCKASAVLKSMAWATPARSALRVAKSVRRKLTSPAKTGAAGAWIRALACVFSSCQTLRCGRKLSMRSNAKRRIKPGAMPQAICAASMAMVPAPQQGSNSGPSSARPCQSAAASIAAARVSFSGASPFTSWRPPWASRHPRLKRASPEVSTYSVA